MSGEGGDKDAGGDGGIDRIGGLPHVADEAVEHQGLGEAVGEPEARTGAREKQVRLRGAQKGGVLKVGPEAGEELELAEGDLVLHKEATGEEVRVVVAGEGLTRVDASRGRGVVAGELGVGDGGFCGVKGDARLPVLVVADGPGDRRVLAFVEEAAGDVGADGTRIGGGAEGSRGVAVEIAVGGSNVRRKLKGSASEGVGVGHREEEVALDFGGVGIVGDEGWRGVAVLVGFSCGTGARGGERLEGGVDGDLEVDLGDPHEELDPVLFIHRVAEAHEGVARLKPVVEDGAGRRRVEAALGALEGARHKDVQLPDGLGEPRRGLDAVVGAVDKLHLPLGGGCAVAGRDVNDAARVGPVLDGESAGEHAQTVDEARGENVGELAGEAAGDGDAVDHVEDSGLGSADVHHAIGPKGVGGEAGLGEEDAR